jgi:hypothetical protein
MGSWPSEITDYKKSSNVRVEFLDVQALPKQPQNQKDGDPKIIGEGTIYHKLCGFLSDDGLTIDYKNKFDSAINLAGGILGQFNELVTSAKGLFDSFQGSQGVRGYVGLSKNASLILNAPYYWQGTDPIGFKLTMIQIADSNNQIIADYQKVLEAVSPDGGPGISIGAGPMLLMVHYFPVSGDGQPDAENGQGKMIFGPCLCHNVSMQIKPPYSMGFEPLIGIYNFDLMVSRIISREKIKDIFHSWGPPKTT